MGASVSGTVRDESGAALAGVQVFVTNNETSGERSLVTDSSGRYAVPSISIGSYTISASKEGFRTEVKTGINLVVGKVAAVDLVLAWAKFVR